MTLNDADRKTLNYTAGAGFNPGLSGFSFVIVEDEFFILTDLTHAISDAGGAVVGSADTIGKALKLVQQRSDFDAALLDVTLRDRAEVYPLADSLCERKIPFVFITGHERLELPERFNHVPYLCKPFDHPQLVAVLRDVLAASKATRCKAVI